jgi:hypothetical protein
VQKYTAQRSISKDEYNPNQNSIFYQAMELKKKETPKELFLKFSFGMYTFFKN